MSPDLSLTEFQRELIEQLIFNAGRPVFMYGGDLHWEEVWGELMGLKSLGLVRNPMGQSPEEAEDKDEEDWENGPFSVRWVYCGGPISKALEVAA